MKTKTLSATALAALLYLPTPSQAGIDPFLGEITTFAGFYCPVGWLPANGQLLLIAQNNALFAILGNSYGGDGRTTFALPNIKPILTVTRTSLTSCIAVQGIFPTRE